MNTFFFSKCPNFYDLYVFTDYLPVINSGTSIINIALKAIFDLKGFEPSEQQRVFKHLKGSSYCRFFVILCLPIVGGFLVGVYDYIHSRDDREMILKGGGENEILISPDKKIPTSPLLSPKLSLSPRKAHSPNEAKEEPNPSPIKDTSLDKQNSPSHIPSPLIPEKTDSPSKDNPILGNSGDAKSEKVAINPNEIAAKEEPNPSPIKDNPTSPDKLSPSTTPSASPLSPETPKDNPILGNSGDAKSDKVPMSNPNEIVAKEEPNPSPTRDNPTSPGKFSPSTTPSASPLSPETPKDNPILGNSGDAKSDKVLMSNPHEIVAKEEPNSSPTKDNPTSPDKFSPSVTPLVSPSPPKNKLIPRKLSYGAESDEELDKRETTPAPINNSPTSPDKFSSPPLSTPSASPLSPENTYSPPIGNLIPRKLSYDPESEKELTPENRELTPENSEMTPENREQTIKKLEQIKRFVKKLKNTPQKDLNQKTPQQQGKELYYGLNAMQKKCNDIEINHLIVKIREKIRSGFNFGRDGEFEEFGSGD